MQLLRPSASALSQSFGFPTLHYPPTQLCRISRVRRLRVRASKENEENVTSNKNEKKQSVLSSVTDALDFSQVRSEEDAFLLEEARTATKAGEKMTRQQYAALRRKIGGTYKDFFKGYVEVDGEYVEEGWVDKTCRICKKDTSNEPRNVDSMGRYAHVACLEKQKERPANIFAWLFGR
eukprot:TRINITY_DN3192_c0_g1_i1.p1 TRINITY_DN3192_c0_g1~~TRINITY_DN3192_c0_g1_i1.p1  ORF type:complete len:178 (+),score=37.68 TRINITY_DN3192_c0_g1_i1:111-644(+)